MLKYDLVPNDSRRFNLEQAESVRIGDSVRLRIRLLQKNLPVFSIRLVLIGRLVSDIPGVPSTYIFTGRVWDSQIPSLIGTSVTFEPKHVIQIAPKVEHTAGKGK